MVIIAQLALEQAVDLLDDLVQAGFLFLLQRFRFHHAFATHRLVPRGRGLDLDAVGGDGTQFDQPALPRQPDHLHEQGRQLLRMQGAEIAHPPVFWEIAGAEHTECDILVQLPGDLARREYATGIRVQQHLDHHRRMKRLIARPAAGVAGVERAQIERVNRIADEIRQMAFGKPVLQCMQQQKLLLGIIREITGAIFP